ncbi:MAG: Threonine-tRNA ligase [Candidatus Levybacteria bacterium GW2011_GWC2_37_7]|nr:MAG: Threonine-tRNA ligase [Candidatus Levybacteria bacterium GW2011_GWC2_37_7]
MDQTKNKDHRQIGQELDLFSFHDVAPGAVFWHPKGWLIYLALQDFIRGLLIKEGYTEISSPVMVKSDLFRKSGHWEHYKENIFSLDIEAESYSLKPMNCPESALIYSAKTRSYQDLPIRYSDFGILHRNELSGVLGGLFRVRQFTIDDAHHFVRPDQIQEEIHQLLLLITDFYKSFKFTPEFYLSTMPDKAMGDPKVWKQAENDLEKALKDAKVKYGIKKKDGAFYGPKIDIHITDSQDRDWQLATIQLDFQIPEKMELEYVDKDGLPKRPIIIHRAILGSLERFIGILTEHYQGAFPLWLSPVQVMLMPITDKQESTAKKIAEELKKQGIRAELDNRPERLQAKIRDSSLQKVPYLGIIGNREIEASSLSVRTREGKDLGALKVPDFLNKLKEEIDKKI